MKIGAVNYSSKRGIKS